MNIKETGLIGRIGIKKLCFYVGASTILGSAIGISVYDRSDNEDKSIIEEAEQLSIILRSHSKEISYDEQTVDDDGELKSFMIPVEVNNITTDNEVFIPKAYKDAIAFNYISLNNDGKNENEFIPIYDENNIPTTGSIYMKTDITNEDGLIIYENIGISKILDYSGFNDKKESLDKIFTGFIEQENPIHGKVLIPEYETIIIKEEKDTMEAKTYSKIK